jgi:thiamine biosynthesis lipoprotein
MKKVELIMGMPVTVEVVDESVEEKHFKKVFNYFKEIDKRFSTYKKNSEVTKINEGKLSSKQFSSEMKEVLKKCEETKKLSNGYFDIERNGKIDPSGLVKGWAIYNASKILKTDGFKNFYVDAGGDIQISGRNGDGDKWRIGIRNPLNRHQNVKILGATNCGIATSGTAIRGQHIYNPKNLKSEIKDILSLTVIAKNIYEADRFATAAFAMGREGIHFLHEMKLDAYMIDCNEQATYTEGFSKYFV